MLWHVINIKWRFCSRYNGRKAAPPVTPSPSITVERRFSGRSDWETDRTTARFWTSGGPPPSIVPLLHDNKSPPRPADRVYAPARLIETVLPGRPGGKLCATCPTERWSKLERCGWVSLLLCSYLTAGRATLFVETLRTRTLNRKKYKTWTAISIAVQALR